MANIKYFKNFTSVRGIAALSVVFSHILQHLNSSFQFKNNLYQIGGIAVTLFFVLSGFLISYLLFAEKEKYKKIHLRKFYLRRIFRIWPLYFTIIIVSSFFYYEQIKQIIWQLLFFLPTIPFVKTEIPNVIDGIWSIGVEEQFYLFFPILFILFDIKKIFKVFIFL